MQMKQQITIFREFSFDSAHFLSKVPEEHKCRKVHGHTYRLKLYFRGEIDPDMGWLIDFSEIKESTSKLLEQLDHNLLNDVDGLENPTCELLAIWIWKRLKTRLPELVRIELNETPNAGVIYEG
jgi:6-pyruvoyltetrahydropterin/6-carboxytetrahydropterin synthase